MSDPLDLIDFATLLAEEEREIQAAVARFLADRVRPHLPEWSDNAHFARELAPELGALGLLGMHLDGVRLPAEARLPGAKGLRGPLSCLNEARFGILFGAVGAGRDSLQAALRYADSRVQFDRPISGFQPTQRKFADMALALGNSALLAVHLGRLKDGGRLRPEQVSVGKLNNVREALAIARECRTVLGANGISLEYSPIRHANNLESVLTYEGTSEIHTLVVGQALTGQAAYR
ncbi:acyl-CoA dehydrogenase family protein [Kitasatospora sp. NPDC127067]|uniref:acyl-CoA dehydrogenase family protein n=1 Tax=Kitasatospora sp. NPDC127067 TaxID=3347126 RepID=UPI00364744FD